MTELAPVKKQNTNTAQQYYVTIGASAGGLEAIHEFFDNMPESSNMSFIIIQHLSSDHKSLLVELVSKHTHMKVFEAGDNIKIEKECVYVIPNNKEMTISKGKIQLSEKRHDKSPNTAIDNFLLSLAKDQKQNAIAIILSGTGTDGTKGIEAIKKAKGTVFVQDPLTAKFDGMPQSAIATGLADFILAPEMMPEELFSLLNKVPPPPVNKEKFDEALLEDIFKLIQKINGVDFHLYKSPTLIRRIAKRMSVKEFKSLDDYVHFLYLNQDEVALLSKDFLIGVTRFYRDPAAFKYLRDEIFPAIIKNKADGEQLKVWVTACSTGEEAYSIAIELDRYCKANDLNLEVKIFATDISLHAIDSATKNKFPDTIEKDIDKKILDEYFVKDEKFYSVIPRIRKRIVFAKHDVTKNPPFIKNDLVTCRNMLIYMNQQLQQKVLYTLNFSVNTGGYLWLGPSETASYIKDGVSEVNTKWKFYRKLSVTKATDKTFYNPLPIQAKQPTTKINAKADSLSKDLHEVLTSDLGYVLFYVGQNYEIKESVGDYSNILSLPSSKLALNILKMVPEELSAAINSAVRRAWKDEKKIVLKNVRVKKRSKDVFFTITVKPPKMLSDSSSTLIILHKNQASEIPSKESTIEYNTNGSAAYLNELEQELHETRLNLQMVNEEMETTNEELQSSNEELLSANEELQSSNEELQSLNEELHTLNTEHQLKINELIELNDDLNNYFRSSDIGQIFIDSNLRIRKYNPAVVKLINLIESDIGRSIKDISVNLKDENLIEDARQVMKTGETIQKEVSIEKNQVNLMRIIPYVRQDKTTDGVVITFTDITAVTELSNLNKGVFNSSRSAIMVFNAKRNKAGEIEDFLWLDANYATNELLNISHEKLIGKGLLKTSPDLVEDNFFDKYTSVVKTGKAFHDQINFGENKWFDIVAVKMMDGIVLSFTDISAQKRSEQKLKKNYSELIGVRENLKKLNSSLEDKISERTKELSDSEERFRLISNATNDTIWDWNIANNSIWWGPNFYKQFGYDETNSAKTRTFWLEKIHPDDRETVSNSIQEVINHSDLSSWSAEYRFLKADGSYANILDRASVQRDDFNTPYRMLGSMLDVTKLHQAEEQGLLSEAKFRRVFESNMIGMLFVNFNGHIIDSNEAFAGMIGYDKVSIRSEKLRFENLVSRKYKDKLAWANTQLVRDGISPTFEAELVKKNGKTFPALMGAASLTEEAESDFVFFIIDITDQKRAENATKLLMQKKDEFMSIASHELKTPITSMKLALQILERLAVKETQNKQIHDFIYKANSQANKLTGLVDDLLNVTKIHAGKMELNRSEFVLNEVVEDCLYQVQHNVLQHEIKIEGDTHINLFADKHRIEQVLSNFISNAIKYSPEAGTILLAIEKNDEEIKISVTDNGIGIPADKVPYIFDRFFRVQESSQKFSGLGLGLYICAEIISRHDGKIGVDSKEGNGSTFWFTLPLLIS